MGQRAPMPANSMSAMLGFGAFAAFSTHDVFIKQLGATYSPFQIVFFSALLSFPIITIVMVRDERPGTLRPAHPWWLALRSVSGAASAVCAFLALAQLPLSQTYAILFTAPLIITVLAVPMLGEKVRLRRGLAVAVGLSGVLIVLRPGASEIGAGHVSALASAFFAALNSVIVRKIGKDERGVVMVLYPMLANLMLTAAVLPFVYVEVPLVDLGLFGVVSLLVLTAMGLLVAAYRRGDAMVVAPMQYSQIIWAALFGALVFGERADLHTYLGSAIVAASGIYIILREARGDVSKTSPVLSSRTRAGHSLGLRVGYFLGLPQRRRTPPSDEGG